MGQSACRPFGRSILTPPHVGRTPFRSSRHPWPIRCRRLPHAEYLPIARLAHRTRRPNTAVNAGATRPDRHVVAPATIQHSGGRAPKFGGPAGRIRGHSKWRRSGRSAAPVTPTDAGVSPSGLAVSSGPATSPAGVRAVEVGPLPRAVRPTNVAAECHKVSFGRGGGRRPGVRGDASGLASVGVVRMRVTR